MAEGTKYTEKKPGDRYEGVPSEIAEVLKQYENDYFRWDKPVPFCGLMIYPAKVTDYEVFSSCSGCFALNRKEDPKGILMTNLGYLYYKMQAQDTEAQRQEAAYYSYSFQKACEIIFHIKNGLKCKECGEVLSYDSPEFAKFLTDIRDLTKKLETGEAQNLDAPQLVCPKCGGTEFSEMIKIVVDPETKKPFLIINGQKIVSKDFDLLRQIVLYQNFPDYQDDSWVDPEIRADYNAKMELQRKKNNLHATLEQKIVGLSISTHYTFDQIYDMTIRKFTMALGTVEDLINYKINKAAAMSGFVQLPKGEKIEHWLYKSDKDLYGDAYKDMDQLKNDLGNV